MLLCQLLFFYSQAKYGRQFSDIESRKDAFLAVKAAVDKHNAEAAEGLHTYTQEVYAHSIMVFSMLQ